MLEFILDNSLHEALASGNSLMAHGEAKTFPIDKVYTGMYKTASYIHIVTHLMTRWNGALDNERRMSVLAPFQFEDYPMPCSSGSFTYNGVDYIFNTAETAVCAGEDYIHPSDVMCTVLEGRFSTESTPAEFQDKFDDYVARANSLYERFFPEIDTPKVVLEYSVVSKSNKHNFNCVRNNHLQVSRNNKPNDKQRGKKKDDEKDSDDGFFTRDYRKIGWDNIGGMFVPKREIRRLIDNFYDPNTMTRLGLDPAEGGGVFFFGDSGNGKTLAAEAIATELTGKYGVDFVPLFADYFTFASKWRGRETIAVANLFRQITEETSNGKIVMLFLDEMQKIGQRDESFNKGDNEVLEQLLVETSRFDHSKCILIAASAQDPSTFDPQLLRRGRFGRTIFFDNPTLDERVDIFRKRLSQLANESSYNPYTGEELDYRRLAQQTEGLTLSDIYHLVGDVVERRGIEIRHGQQFRPFSTDDLSEQIEETRAKKSRARSRIAVL